MHWVPYLASNAQVQCPGASHAGCYIHVVTSCIFLMGLDGMLHIYIDLLMGDGHVAAGVHTLG